MASQYPRKIRPTTFSLGCWISTTVKWLRPSNPAKPEMSPPQILSYKVAQENARVERNNLLARATRSEGSVAK